MLHKIIWAQSPHRAISLLNMTGEMQTIHAQIDSTALCASVYPSFVHLPLLTRTAATRPPSESVNTKSGITPKPFVGLCIMCASFPLDRPMAMARVPPSPSSMIVENGCDIAEIVSSDLNHTPGCICTCSLPLSPVSHAPAAVAQRCLAPREKGHVRQKIIVLFSRNFTGRSWLDHPCPEWLNG